MDAFDEFANFYRTLGLDPDAARVAAQGRFKTESDARAAYLTGEAEDLAESLRDRQARGEQLLAEDRPPLNHTALANLPVAAAEVVAAAQDVLRMSPADAKDMAARLHARETRRGGVEHANRFAATFAHALRRPAREVAPR